MPKPVRVTATTEGARRLYNTRDLRAGGMVDIDAASVDVAVILGYIQPPPGWKPLYRMPMRPQTTEPAEEVPQVSDRPRGRPRREEPEKSEAEEPKLEERTVEELREMAEEKGVELPAGYVRKSELIELVGGTDEEE
jgi:hypothetical protein